MRTLATVLLLLAGTGAAVAQKLECKTIEEILSGSGGAVITASAKLSPEDIAAGFTVTGGACDFSSGRDAHAYPVFSRVAGDRYECRARSTSSNDGLIVRATAVACRLPRIDRPADARRRAPTTNAGLGGDTVTALRAGRAAIPHSVRLCNLRGGLPLDVVLGAQQNVQVPAYACIEVDKPQRVMFRTPTSVSVDVRGYYEIFKPGTFKAAPRVGRPSDVPNQERIDITGSFQTATAPCRQPPIGEPFDAGAFWGYCALTGLTPKRNYRICFDQGFTGQGSALEYPGGLLRIVLDKALLTKPKPGSLDPYLYMPTSAEGCRDIYGVEQAFIAIVDNSWNGQSVKEIAYRFVEIPSAP